MTRALITNDDGVGSLGLRALAGCAANHGLDVVVAAPSWDSSGASASLTHVEQGGRFILEERSFDELPDVEVFAVEAAPAFIVRAAVTGAFGEPPDVVLSGVNLGPNTGHAVLHSGTVGAALTASTFGVRAMAVSITTGEAPNWDTAAALAGLALDWILASESPVILNVNVPDVPLDEVAGFEQTRLAAFGAVQTTITETGVGYVKLAYDEVEADFEPGTDAAALAKCAASYTPLLAVCEAGGVDATGITATFEAGRPAADPSSAPTGPVGGWSTVTGKELAGDTSCEEAYMRAAVWHGKRDVRVDTVPDPILKEPTDAIIKVTTTGLCGSDLHLYEILAPFMAEGDILGHEPMGIVEEVGSAVTGIEPGDRVVVPFQIACGHCFMCGQGLQTQCETTQVRDHGMGAALLGYSKLYGAVAGGQAEYLRVPQAQYGPIKVPEGPVDDLLQHLDRTSA